MAKFVSFVIAVIIVSMLDRSFGALEVDTFQGKGDAAALEEYFWKQRGTSTFMRTGETDPISSKNFDERVVICRSILGSDHFIFKHWSYANKSSQIIIDKAKTNPIIFQINYAYDEETKKYTIKYSNELYLIKLDRFDIVEFMYPCLGISDDGSLIQFFISYGFKGDNTAFLYGYLTKNTVKLYAAVDW